MKLSGINVVDEEFIPFASEKSYIFYIRVQASRLNNICFGTIKISMSTYTYVGERFHQASIYEASYSTATATNLNNQVLEVVGTAFNMLK